MSSIKFQSHIGWKTDDWQFYARILGRSQLSNPSHLPCVSGTHYSPGCGEGYRKLTNSFVHFVTPPLLWIFGSYPTFNWLQANVCITFDQIILLLFFLNQLIRALPVTHWFISCHLPSQSNIDFSTLLSVEPSHVLLHYRPECFVADNSDLSFCGHGPARHVNVACDENRRGVGRELPDNIWHHVRYLLSQVFRIDSCHVVIQGRCTGAVLVSRP